MHHLRCFKLCKWFVLSSCAGFLLSTVAFEMKCAQSNLASLSLSCKQVTDHRVEGTTHTAMFQSSSPCTFRMGKERRVVSCRLRALSFYVFTVFTSDLRFGSHMVLVLFHLSHLNEMPPGRASLATFCAPNIFQVRIFIWHESNRHEHIENTSENVFIDADF